MYNHVCIIYWTASWLKFQTLLQCWWHDALKTTQSHDDDIKLKHFPRYSSFVREIHRWPVNSPQKGPVTWSFDMRVNKQLSKQSMRRWFETPSRSLWHQCNAQVEQPETLSPKWKLKRFYRCSCMGIHYTMVTTGCLSCCSVLRGIHFARRIKARTPYCHATINIS